jgi:hypothetical protein
MGSSLSAGSTLTTGVSCSTDTCSNNSRVWGFGDFAFAKPLLLLEGCAVSFAFVRRLDVLALMASVFAAGAALVLIAVVFFAGLLVFELSAAGLLTGTVLLATALPLPDLLGRAVSVFFSFDVFVLLERTILNFSLVNQEEDQKGQLAGFGSKGIRRNVTKVKGKSSSFPSGEGA